MVIPVAAQVATTTVKISKLVQHEGLKDWYILESAVTQPPFYVQKPNAHNSLFFYDGTTITNKQFVHFINPSFEERATKTVFKSFLKNDENLVKICSTNVCPPLGQRNNHKLHNGVTALGITFSPSKKDLAKRTASNTYSTSINRVADVQLTAIATTHQVHCTPKELHQRYFNLPPPANSFHAGIL